MKKIIWAIAIITLVSCNKEDASSNSGGNTTNAVVNNTVFYIDSAKIYSTTTTGTTKTLVVGIDTNNINSYISSWMALSKDGNKLYFIHRISGSTPSAKLYVVNKNGTGLTALKTLTATNEYGFMQHTNDDKITFYQASFTPPSTFTNTIQQITTDGSTQTTLGTIPSTFAQVIRGISRAADRFVSTGTTGGGVTVAYTGTLSTGTLGVPRSLPMGALNPKLSSDGKKIAYVKETAANTFQIYSYDVATEAEVLVGTQTFVFATMAYQVKLNWVDGTNKILISAGKFTFPNGAASDYTQCSLYTVGSTTAATNWQFAGDDAAVFTE